MSPVLRKLFLLDCSFSQTEQILLFKFTLDVFHCHSKTLIYLQSTNTEFVLHGKPFSGQQTILHTPLSTSSAKPSGNGHAVMKRRLCLLGDLERHKCLDTANTVSRYDTTGSDFLSGIQAWSSSKSFKQISR